MRALSANDPYWELLATLAGFQRLDVGDERPQSRVGDDPAPMGHRDDRRSSEDAASPDDLDDLLVGVELIKEVGAGERRDRLVGRLRVGHAAEPVRAVAVDAAVALVEERALDRRALAGDHGRRGRS